MGHAVDLFEYFVAHDGHPCEGCKEEKLVEVSQNCATNLGKLTAVVLVDNKDEEGKDSHKNAAYSG